MRKVKLLLDCKLLLTIYVSFIMTMPEYGDVVWDNCTQQEKVIIEKIQIEAARIVTGTKISLDKLDIRGNRLGNP